MNALAKYQKTIEGISSFQVSGAPSLDSLASGDAKKTLEWGVSAMRELWAYMPKEVRKAALDALDDLLEKIAATSQGVGKFSDSLKSIKGFGGPITQAIISIVNFAVSASHVNTILSVDAMKTGRMVGRTLTILDQSRPISESKITNMATGSAVSDSWDWSEERGIRGYIRWVKPERNPTVWSWEPSFRPMTVEGLMFGWGERQPWGRWKAGNGIPMKCGFGSAVYNGMLKRWGGCHPPAFKGSLVGEAAKSAYRAESFQGCVTVTMPWAYPWGVLSERPGPYEVVLSPDGKKTRPDWPNEILAREQLELFSMPRVNLAANGDRILHMATSMAKWMGSRLFVKSDTLEVDEKGRMTRGWSSSSMMGIDEKKDPGNTGSTNSKRYYLDDLGAVRKYNNTSTQTPTPDLTRVGFRMRDGEGGDPIITFAQYNLMIEGAALFFSARSAFLDDHKSCRGMVEDGFDLKVRDKGLADAIRASASTIIAVEPGGSGDVFFPTTKKNPPRKKSPPARGGFKKPGFRPNIEEGLDGSKTAILAGAAGVALGAVVAGVSALAVGGIAGYIYFKGKKK